MNLAPETGSDPQFIQYWEQVLFRFFGFQAKLVALDGEFDLNFSVLQNGVPTHVMKVMRPDCPRSLIELQCDALEHINRQAPDIVVPRVVQATNKELFVAVADQNEFKKDWSG